MRSCTGWLVFPYLQRLTVQYCLYKEDFPCQCSIKMVCYKQSRNILLATAWEPLFHRAVYLIFYGIAILNNLLEFFYA